MKPEEPHGVRNPGKPTWQEVLDGYEALQLEAGRRVRMTLEVLQSTPRPLIESEKGTPARVGAENAFSEASATF